MGWSSHHPPAGVLEIPRAVGWKEVEPRALKWLPLARPRPGRTLGSGKTQKMGNIRACHCAVAGVSGGGLGRVPVTSLHCPFPLPGPNLGSLVSSPAPCFSFPLSSSHPSSWVPIPDPWFPPAAGASLDAAEPRALSGSSSGQRKARVSETRDTYLPGRLSTSCFSLAGVRLRGPARSLAQLGAGHLANPGHPSRRSAARCHRTRHTEAPSTAPGLCPALPRHRSRQTTPCHPRSPPLLPL